MNGEKMEQLIFAELKFIDLESSFEQILGSHQLDMSEITRRNRWAQWLKLARKKDRERMEYWINAEGCEDCINRRGKAWCNLSSLPCAVNPILTFREGISGMACMGFGYKKTKHKAK